MAVHPDGAMTVPGATAPTPTRFQPVPSERDGGVMIRVPPTDHVTGLETRTK